MISYCGINCNECPAYRAYVNDDEELRIETAKRWNSPDYPVDPDDVFCTGCRSNKEPHFKWCGDCPIRACGSERSVETCAHCDQFPCDRVEAAGKENLDRLMEIKKSL